MQEVEFRPVPKHIDKSERIAEIALIFAFVFFIVRIPVVLSIKNPDGSEVGYLTILAFTCSYLYHKATARQKPGFILHKGYLLGMPVRGLIEQSIKRLVK
ncbi:hypothetical protein RQP54_18480 [Curvibacter sp. APW13]|uniref:hypothetical protein n=1 Tax=Curvibacter sp. APW13 TaxID=3077236 RepID=UPI0028DDB541|nr:hypothetical protein [Curvibacter sp. APW13]MDT8992867.1 hypothetical protein [Curvibacter sp. APW13]